MSSRPPLLGREPDPELAERVFARREGNPLFMEALLRSDTLANPGLPGSLRDLVLADVRRLPARTQQVLEALSVAGQHSGQALLAAVTGLDDDPAAGSPAADRRRESADLMRRGRGRARRSGPGLAVNG